MRSRIGVSAVAVGLILTVVGVTSRADDSESGTVTRSPETRVVEAEQEFGFQLLHRLAQSRELENVMVSPFSIVLALAMTANGAAADTLKGMKEAIGVDQVSLDTVNRAYRGLIPQVTSVDREVRFQSANSIWYRQGMEFESSFLECNREFYGALVQPLDFADPAAADRINHWVSEATHDHVPTMIDKIDPLSAMFLLNAVYFKGWWQDAFDPDQTREAPFTRADGSTTSCQMMGRTGSYRFVETERFQAVELPYRDGRFTMVVVLPQKTWSLKELRHDVNSHWWARLLESLSNEEGTLELPRCTLRCTFELNDALDALGMGVALAPGADFSRMYRGPDSLYISKVKHKTFMCIDEEGTEAAAATSVEMRCTAMPPSFAMRVDRPFLCCVRDTESGLILFAGQVTDPSASS